MTRDEFIQKFKELAPQAKWKIQYRGIWGICNGFEFCPITFVHYKITNRTYDRGNFDHAGAEIGLTRNSIFDIMGASDGMPECSMKLRRSLIEAAKIPIP